MIQSLPMRGRKRREYLHQQVEIIGYHQTRNAIAAQCHRKATLQRLKELGIKLAKLRCCRLE
jgi:hypothetical protein